MRYRYEYQKHGTSDVGIAGTDIAGTDINYRYRYPGYRYRCDVAQIPVPSGTEGQHHTVPVQAATADLLYVASCILQRRGYRRTSNLSTDTG